MEEAGGKSSIYVHPDDDEALARALLSTIEDEGLRATMIADGIEHSLRFAPEVMAREIMEVYNNVLMK